jgi:hypothetical protein
MNARLLFFAAMALPVVMLAQPVLLPSIGIGALPADSDPVCSLPVQTPPIASVGRPEGESAADFTLYDLNGIAFNLEDALLIGKPVLMISASYTCPVFRNKIPLINDVVATYGSQLTTVIIYTVEAHPDVDISPYFGAVNTGAQNISAGILYEQPDTYGERKAVLQDLLDSLQIDAPIYLDGPCNEWWNYYGPQPNNAYLIDTTGIIFRHHDWLDKDPDDIYCDIDSLLGLPTDCEQIYGGHLDLQMVSNDTVYGDAGSTITAELKLWNPTTEELQIKVAKLIIDLPVGWTSSLCLDVCYLPTTDTAIVEIAAGDTMHFYYYFYTTPGAATGYTRVGLRNEFDFPNNYMRDVWAISSDANSIAEHEDVNALVVVPNPATDRITLQGVDPRDAFEIRDLSGRVVGRFTGSTADVDQLPAGLYAVAHTSTTVPIILPSMFVKN